MVETEPPTQVAGWVKRKVKNSEKWVRRWLEVNKYVLYSYQACPAETPQARVMNTLDLRKTREIKLVADDKISGLFVIVPESTDVDHPGYLMRVDTNAMAEMWVNGLNQARSDELTKLGKLALSDTKGRRQPETTCCGCCSQQKTDERAGLLNAHNRGSF